jgi:DNA-binding response OmpR family regulator
MSSAAKSPGHDLLHAAWGSLPPRIRTLYIVARQGMGAPLASALAADSASRVLLDEAVGSAAGLAALREQIYDAVLVSHLPGELDALEFVEGLRAGGAEESVIILGVQSEADLSALCFEVGADAYLSLNTTARTFLWTLARAVERHQLIGQNRRLAQAERNRSQQEQREAERLLAGQRAVVDDCARSAAVHGSPIPAAVRTHYRDLLRAHVIMGSGNLSAEMSALAGIFASLEVAAHEVLRLHVEAVEELVRGLGSRSARHVMTRADLLICELLVELTESHRTGHHERAASLPLAAAR